MNPTTTSPGRKRLRSSTPPSCSASSSCDANYVNEWLNKNDGTFRTIRVVRISPTPLQPTVPRPLGGASVNYCGHLGDLYDWHNIYDRKALLARVLVEISESGNPDGLVLCQDYHAIKQVKFFTVPVHQDEDEDVDDEEEVHNPDVKVFKVVHEGHETKSAFEEHLTIYSDIDFPQPENLPEEYKTLRDQLKKTLKQCELKYTDGQGWAGHAKMNKMKDLASGLSPSAFVTHTVYKVAGAFRAALCGNMRHEDGKGLIEALGLFLSEHVGGKVHLLMRMQAPGNYSGSNSKVEVLASGDEINYDRPYNEKPRETYFGMVAGQPEDNIPAIRQLVYPKQLPKKEVPDFLWLYPTDAQDMFLLSVKIRPEHAINDAIFQCCKQLLSKLHFQEFIIGLVMAPRRFCFILAYKKDDTIYMSRYEKPFTKDQRPTGSNSAIPFEENSACQLMDMLARIMMYAKQRIHARCKE